MRVRGGDDEAGRDLHPLVSAWTHDLPRCRRALTGETGTALPPFTDHHVHLHLVDGADLPAQGIAAVVDLGGDPALLARRPHDELPHVAYAGCFLTAPGGYPTGRAWAPETVVREITDASAHPGVPGGAVTAVDDQISFGATVIKVALNATAGPVLARHALDVVVARAHEHGLPVVAHVEGEGMTRLAVDAGVDVLAHTPFSEDVDAELVARAATSGMAWISTLDIHRDDEGTRERAIRTLGAFARAGGRVLYGTDLGNGDLPLGVNPRELAALSDAGLDATGILRALTDPWPTAHPPSGVATFVPDPRPDAVEDLPAWLARATVVPTEELLHDEL